MILTVRKHLISYFKEKKKKIESRIVLTLESLSHIFYEKFTNVGDIGDLTFYIKHPQYGVIYQLENIEDFYNNSIIEVRVFQKEIDLKKEIEQVKRQLSELEKEVPIEQKIEDDGENIVFLRGLPWKAKPSDIYNFFEGLSIEDIYIVRNSHAHSTGEAFVQFSDENNVKIALNKNKGMIGQRYIDIFKSTKEDRKQAIKRSKPWNPNGADEKSTGPSDITSIVIKMRGLPFSARNKDIVDFFGNIKPCGVHLIHDYLGRVQGEGYVEFSSENEVLEAMVSHGKYIGHRYIELYPSSHEELNKAMLQSKDNGPVPTTLNSTVVRMRGLSYGVQEYDCKHFFDGIDVVGIHIIRDHKLRASGEAYVEFSSIEAGAEALKRNKNYIGNRYIDLFPSSMNEMDVAIKQSFGGRKRTRIENGNYGTTSDRFGNDNFARRNKINKMGGHSNRFTGHSNFQINSTIGNNMSSQNFKTRCVRMEGIPFSYTQKDIASFFQKVQVIPIRMHRKTKGGEAYIEFANEHDARLAMKLNGMHLTPNIIRVRLISYEQMASIVGL